MNGLEILHTSRLILRRLQSTSEVAALADLWADPDVTRYVGGPRDRDTVVADLQCTLESSEHKAVDLWPLLDRDNGRVVGHCGLLRKNLDGRSEIEVVCVLARLEWGQGYATEIAVALKRHAFTVVGLQRVVALIDPDNIASEHVARNLGMQHERDIVRPDGSLWRVYAAESNQSRPQLREMLGRFKYGAASWNLWRRDNPDAVIVLDGADLSGMILTGIDFSRVSLRGAALHATNLMSADLRGADLTGADLSEADLIAAKLQDAVLSGANFHETDLLGADLTHARYRTEDLAGALHIPPAAVG